MEHGVAKLSPKSPLFSDQAADKKKENFTPKPMSVYCNPSKGDGGAKMFLKGVPEGVIDGYAYFAPPVCP